MSLFKFSFFKQTPEISSKLTQELRAYFEAIGDLIYWINLQYNEFDEITHVEHGLPDTLAKGPIFGEGVIPNDGSLVIELCHTIPKYFHTPLGRFQVIDTAIVTPSAQVALLERLYERLSLAPLQNDQYHRKFGPLYSVNSNLEGQPLPRLLQKDLGNRDFLDSLSISQHELWEKIKPTFTGIESRALAHFISTQKTLFPDMLFSPTYGQSFEIDPSCADFSHCSCTSIEVTRFKGLAPSEGTTSLNFLEALTSLLFE